MKRIFILMLIVCFGGITGCASNKGYFHDVVVHNATGNFIKYRITNESGFDVTATKNKRIFIPAEKFKIERFCTNVKMASELYDFDQETTIELNKNKYCGSVTRVAPLN